MIEFGKFLVFLLSWLQIFLSPVLAAAGISTLLFIQMEEKAYPYIIVLSILGVAAGIYLAERVRKKKGVETFLGEINATNDIKNFDDRETKTPD